MSKIQIIPSFIADDKFTPTTVSPHIYFFNGVKECENYIINYNGTYNNVNKYTYFDIYDGVDVNENSKSLLFYNEEAINGVTPTESLYSKFWSKYISTLYNPQARLIDANAIIPLYDYLNFVLNDIVSFNNNYYHLRAINNYDLNSGECSVQLLGPIIYDSLNVKSILNNTIPSAQIVNYSNVAYNISVTGEVTDEGSDTLIDAGIVYATHSSPTIADNKISKGALFNFTANFNVLSDTNYYVSVYAQNSAGIFYTPAQLINIPKSSVAPSVTTNDASNLTINSVIMNGYLNSNPFGSITERGFCWGTASNPTISGNHQAISGTIGTMVLQKYNEFIPGQLMHYRAYAKNNYETAYGIDKTFTIINKEYTLISRVINNSSSIFPILTLTLNADTWLNSENFVFTDEIPSSIDSYTFTQKIYNTSTVTVYAEFTTNNNQVNDAGIFDGNHAILNTLNSWYLGSNYVSFDFRITYDNGSNNIYVDFIITD